MKGICHNLFVNTRTQLNLNKIVISKQHKNLILLNMSEKEQKIASTKLEDYPNWKKFMKMIMPQWISQRSRSVQSDRDSFMQ